MTGPISLIGVQGPQGTQGTQGPQGQQGAQGGGSSIVSNTVGLSGDQPIAHGIANVIATTGALAAGTWLVTAVITIVPGATTTWMQISLEAGSATVTSGLNLAEVDFTTGQPEIQMVVQGIVVITVGGTLQIGANCAVADSTAKQNRVNNGGIGTGPVSYVNSVKIA